MNTIKIYFNENGNISSVVKNFPLYQGQFQNKLLNIIIPTSLLQADFTVFSYDTETGTITGGTAVVIACETPTSSGVKYVSTNRYMRYVKTFTYNNIECALFERMLPKEFCFYAGTMTMIVNVINVDNSTTPATISELVANQQCQFEVLASGSLLDNDATVEPSEITSLEAQINTVSANVALKQDITDNSLNTDQKTIVGAINEVDTHADTNATNIATNTGDISSLDTRVGTLEATVSTGENYITTITGTDDPSLITSSQLDATVLSVTGRASKNGDTIIYIQTISQATDKNFKFIKSQDSGWLYYEIPPMESATNTDKGIVRGNYNASSVFSSTNYIMVSITNGVIDNVYCYDAQNSIYRPLGVYLNSVDLTNKTFRENVISGAQIVGKSTIAYEDENGDNIVGTYLTKQLGATKQYVKDYAIAKIFNNVYYVSSLGYVTSVPTSPADERQFTTSFVSSDTPYVDKTMFSLEMLLDYNADLTYKNTYSTRLSLGSSVDISGTTLLTLTTYYYDDATSTWQPLTVDQRELTVNDRVEVIEFGNNFNLLSPATQVHLTAGVSKIKQVLEIQVSDTSTAVSYYVMCGTTYQTTFGLEVSSMTITITTGLVGELPTMEMAFDNTTTNTFRSTQIESLTDDLLYYLEMSIASADISTPSGEIILDYDGTTLDKVCEPKELLFTYDYLQRLPYTMIGNNRVYKLLANYCEGKLTIYSQNLYGYVATNTSNIATNTSNIATNTTDIANIKSGTQIVGKATADASGNVITTTYATKGQVEDIIGGTQIVGKATADASGNVITDTYAKTTDLENGTIIVGKAIADQNGNVINTTYSPLIPVYQIADDLPTPEISLSGTILTITNADDSGSIDLYVNDNIADVIFVETQYAIKFTSSSIFSLATTNNTKNWDGTLEYSIDNSTWATWSGTSSIVSSASGLLLIRGTGNTVITGSLQTKQWSFTSTENIYSSGKIELLLDYATVLLGNHPTMSDYAFSFMFQNQTTLITAPDISFETATNYCCKRMFYGCTSLATAPTLSSTTMASNCYQEMFLNCTALTQAPSLPATILAGACYNQMFSGCTSLTQAPSLPATILYLSCYGGMFNGCTSLTQAPLLPATTTADYCYSGMFYGCTSLATSPNLPATILALSCYYNMFFGCTSLTSTPSLPATTLANYCYNYMFYGCTSLTTISSLPATTLAESCYENMFQGCTSLTNIPSLPATSLAKRCYWGMFNGCTSLTSTPSLNATIMVDSCYSRMFQDCASLTTAPSLEAIVLASYCYSSMFLDCTSLTSAPSLPSTILTEGCYSAMFSGCTSLTTMPSLPATILKANCYNRMFYGCSLIKLSTTQDTTYTTAYRIPTNGTGTSADITMLDMFGFTGGTFTGTPTINVTYYTSNTLI